MYNHRKSRRNIISKRKIIKGKIGSNKSHKRQHSHAIRPSFRVILQHIETIIIIIIITPRQQQIEAIISNKGFSGECNLLQCSCLLCVRILFK